MLNNLSKSTLNSGAVQGTEEDILNMFSKITYDRPPPAESDAMLTRIIRSLDN